MFSSYLLLYRNMHVLAYAFLFLLNFFKFCFFIPALYSKIDVAPRLYNASSKSRG